MTRNDYHFITHWRVPGTVEEVTQVFRKGADLSRWWPAVYLDAKELDPGDENGLGYVTDLYSKSWLPYTVRWRSKAVEVRHPHGFTIEATGDFVGRGVWTFEQDGDWVNMTYDWRIRTNKPLLRYGAFLFKPLYEWNHRWAMKKGEESLKLELARRRARTPQERAAIPAPPGPTTTSPVPLLFAAALLFGAGAGLIYLASKARRVLAPPWGAGSLTCWLLGTALTMELVYGGTRRSSRRELARETGGHAWRRPPRASRLMTRAAHDGRIRRAP